MKTRSALKRGSIVVALLLVSAGCDAISDVVGALGAASDVAEHIDEDVAAPLTDARIDKVVEVLPALQEFSKEAKVKWQPDSNAHNLSNLAKSITGLNEYIAFFESHDTRLTQFYVDWVKINDARSKILFQRGQKEAREKLEKEKASLEGQLKGASAADAKKLTTKLKRIDLTLEQLEKSSKAAEELKQANDKAGYKLTQEEIALVEARLDELSAVIEQNGDKGDVKEAQ